MTTLDELRPQLEAALDDLCAAVEPAADHWHAPLLEPEGPKLRDEDDDDSPWAPRDAAEHAGFGLLLNLAFAEQDDAGRTDSMGDFASAWIARMRSGEIAAPEFTSAAVALAGLADFRERMRATLSALDPRALSAPAAFMPGQEDYLQQRGVTNDADVATVLRLSVTHLHDHADQIRRAIAAASA